ADEIIPFIATLMGFRLSDRYEKRIEDISGDSLKKLIQNSIQNLILKGSQAKPIVFIIEDIHWTDISSLDLLQSLFRLAEHNKILFISTLRPNFQETGERIISIINQRYPHFYTEIKLEPLNSENCDRLLSNLLRMDELPIQLKNSVAKNTEGNPFFIEEVIRSLIDDNIIEIKNSRFHISKPALDLSIPGSIKELLLSRIDKLDEPEKNLLKTASVIGRHFMYDILIKVCGNAGDVDPRIKHLEKLELIKENTDTREREYLFKHALVQEAVYETLLTRNKQELHLKTAHAIEDLFSERIHDFFEMLAHHYGKADDREKAEEYLIKAGERTLKTAASYEALNYFSQALKLYMQKYGSAADKEKIFMLEKNIGLSFYNRGYFRDALEHFNKALNAKGMKTDRRSLNETFRFILNFILIIKHLYISFPKKRSPGEKDYELFDILFKMVTAYANIDGKKMFFELLNLIRLKMGFELNGEDGFITYSVAGSLFCFSSLSFSLGKKFIAMANRHARLHGIQEIFQNGYDETLCDYLSGNWKNFKTINEKLLDIKLKKGELIYVTYQISWALYIVICRGEYEYAGYLARKGDEISMTYDFDYGKLYMLSMKGDLELNRRNLHKAIQYYDESLELAGKLSLDSWIMGLSGKKAKALLLLNDIGSAKEALEAAEKAAAEAGSLAPMFLGYLAAYRLFYHTRLFELKLSSPSGKNELDEIKNKIEKIIKTADHISNKVAEIKPEVERFSGIYFQLINKNRKAIHHFENSIRSARDLGAVPELGRAYLDTAKFLQKHSMKLRNIEAEGYFSEAADIFKKLNLKWDLDELNRIKPASAAKQ
ncbi:MAG TPA: hypothetical protein VMT35_11625, partial [Ignavibacteriaceae bacterium]|nr:hypothetical protein [Ignavibacteriaceae bacterium]